MSLATGQNKISYDVSASTTDFAFPYKYWDSSDLVITKENKTTGLITTLLIGTDYSIVAVNGDPDTGATITLVAAVDDHTVVIERLVPLKSDANFTIGDGIPPDSINEALDKSAAQSQQLDEVIGRQVSFPVTDADGLTYEIPAVSIRANKVMSFDNAGNVAVVELSESGSFGADSTKGISISSNIASAKVDDTSIEFDTIGNISVKDAGIETAMLADDAVTFDKMAHLSTMTVIGNVTGTTAIPAEVSILDEDDLVSDSATALATQQSIKAYTDAKETSLLGTFKILQVANVQDGAMQYFASSTPIPNDDTIPQSTEGDQVMSLAFTPTSATSKLKIEVVTNFASNLGQLVSALFKDSDTDAMAVAYSQQGASTPTNHSFSHYMTAGGTSAITFKVRIGSEGTQNTFNGDNPNSAKYGGTIASSITITEIKA